MHEGHATATCLSFSCPRHCHCCCRSDDGAAWLKLRNGRNPDDRIQCPNGRVQCPHGISIDIRIDIGIDIRNRWRHGSAATRGFGFASYSHGRSVPEQVVQNIGTLVVAFPLVYPLQDDRPNGQGYRLKPFRQQNVSTVVEI